tara:strand:+ start:93 stop:638 length:546 start_codon:yes stop_codon:yes gene_type:complete
MLGRAFILHELNTLLKQDIAAALEVAFSQHGFAEPSVAKLQKLSGVSLRTLYKYYPSKQAMIIAALEYRHNRYINFLLKDAPAPGVEAVLHMFDQLKAWMVQFAPNGCLSINALSAFPEDEAISLAVQTHKNDVKKLLGEQGLNSSLASSLFLLHEGVSSAWPVMGDEAVTSAKNSILKLI